MARFCVLWARRRAPDSVSAPSHRRDPAFLSSPTPSTGLAGPFDAIIIATPLEGSNLRLSGPGVPAELPPPRPFQLTVTSYVTGALNTTTFPVGTSHCQARHVAAVPGRFCTWPWGLAYSLLRQPFLT